jgi:hypothetical protein
MAGACVNNFSMQLHCTACVAMHADHSMRSGAQNKSFELLIATLHPLYMSYINDNEVPR